jgi:hypothetical protein
LSVLKYILVKPYVFLDPASSLPEFKNLRNLYTSIEPPSRAVDETDSPRLVARIEVLEAQVKELLAVQAQLLRQMEKQPSGSRTELSPSRQVDRRENDQADADTTVAVNNFVKVLMEVTEIADPQPSIPNTQFEFPHPIGKPVYPGSEYLTSPWPNTPSGSAPRVPSESPIRRRGGPVLELPNTLPQNFEDDEDMASPSGSEAGPAAPGLSSSGLDTEGAMTHGGSSGHEGSAEVHQGVAAAKEQTQSCTPELDTRGGVTEDSQVVHVTGADMTHDTSRAVASETEATAPSTLESTADTGSSLLPFNKDGLAPPTLRNTTDKVAEVVMAETVPEVTGNILTGGMLTTNVPGEHVAEHDYPHVPDGNLTASVPETSKDILSNGVLAEPISTRMLSEVGGDNLGTTGRAAENLEILGEAPLMPTDLPTFDTTAEGTSTSIGGDTGDIPAVQTSMALVPLVGEGSTGSTSAPGSMSIDAVGNNSFDQHADQTGQEMGDGDVSMDPLPVMLKDMSMASSHSEACVESMITTD